ncbi:hypothetical protein GCM10011611_48210 [Aliidongia dinghuensis]|uniref:Uncharacterized protein n=1 Tax=Aliidongia dinghuensis TaxID=1867774 RepID=A0A8J2YZ57_9PROT|nr:hypothetical protein [Aliidongia dinghuensis]GGF36143.1 hypothetical protein GCM10011611_48210 [Aliidongia dinghuensis]
MLGVLNEAEFADPKRLERWRAKAMGWDEAQRRAEGGIHDLREMKIRRGSVLFRIGHSTSARGAVPDEINLSSPWWMSDEAFLDICASARITGIELQSLGRYKLSVAERYGVFDLVFQVITCGPLGTFRGIGVPVFDGPEGDRPLAWPGREVPQYFIPGLRDLDSNRPTGLAREAFVQRPNVPVGRWMQHLDALSGT